MGFAHARGDKKVGDCIGIFTFGKICWKPILTYAHEDIVQYIYIDIYNIYIIYRYHSMSFNMTYCAIRYWTITHDTLYWTVQDNWRINFVTWVFFNNCLKIVRQSNLRDLLHTTSKFHNVQLRIVLAEIRPQRWARACCYFSVARSINSQRCDLRARDQATR